MSKIQYTEPVDRIMTVERDGQWIEMVTHDFGIVGVSTDSTDEGTWGLQSGHGKIDLDYEPLFAILVAAYFSEVGSALEIAYEKPGDPPVPMWERILHSYGFSFD